MSGSSLERGKPVYFLLDLSGLTIFDVKFSSYAPSTDAVLLGGLVNAISTFSDSVMDNISSESGTLNVIEREGMKIMFERGQQIEAILVVDKESQILMEKIRAIIDVFEYSYLDDLKDSIIHDTKYHPFQEMTQYFILSHLDENIVFKVSKISAVKSSTIKIPPKFTSLMKAFNGKKSIIEVARKLNWPLTYCVARTAMLQELGYLKSLDILIKGTDIFKIEDKYINILLEQGMAYQTILRHWGDWGIKITQKIDGKHSLESLSENLQKRDRMKMNQLFRYLSLKGYISLLTDSELLLIIFEEFLRFFRKQLLDMFGEEITYSIFEIIFLDELKRTKKQGRMISVAKLVENYMNNLYFEKLEAVINSRPEIMTPLFQNAFLPFLDHILYNMTKIIGKTAAMDLLKITILGTERYYGTLVYDILFTS